MAESLPTVRVKKGKGEVVTINVADLPAWQANGYKLVSEEAATSAE